MAPKTAKKARSKSTREPAQPSQGTKRPSSSQPPQASPISKKSKKKHSVSNEPQYDSTRFVDFIASRLFKSLSKARISDAKVFDFLSLYECGLELTDAFEKFGIRRFCMVDDECYPELVREFYANARK